jgi:hypothetical protein
MIVPGIPFEKAGGGPVRRKNRRRPYLTEYLKFMPGARNRASLSSQTRDYG